MIRWPILTDGDRQAIARVLDRGVLSGAAAPEMRALEAEFAAANPDLLDRGLLLRHYPRDQLQSPLARRVFVLPQAVADS